MSDPLKPDMTLLCKLGSIVIHLEEHASHSGMEIDLLAARSIVNDTQVQEWLVEMSALSLMPVKR